MELFQNCLKNLMEMELPKIWLNDNGIKGNFSKIAYRNLTETELPKIWLNDNGT